MAELYQVEFKGSRREFFYNKYYHTLNTGDHVIVQAEQGEDLGRVVRQIEVEAGKVTTESPRSILRHASDEDLGHFQALKEKETTLQQEIGPIIKRHGLGMKVVDVECLFDGGKITFYFTADHRVDFRALVRDLASRYRTRIELRQIGVRDEAKRLDGFGICGRRQCCNSHLREFAPVSTQHAREQDLSLNPAKISGNCGRLLCCLRYEVDLYTSAKKLLPPVGKYIRTDKGSGKISRIDVFSGEAVFFNEDDVLCRVRPEEIHRPSDDRRGPSRPPQRPDQDPPDEGDSRPDNTNDSESESYDN